MKVYRIITDEPQGICVGFQPEGMECDAFKLDEDNGGDFVHIQDNGTIKINKLPNGAEPDLLIWRTPKEFETWRGEMHEHPEGDS